MWWAFNESSSLSTIDVDSQRQIRCYDGYNISHTPLAEGTSSGIYTKCMQVGSGWGEGNKQASFSIQGKYDPQSRGKVTAGVDVTIYSSERVAYFPNGTLPSWLPSVCLSNSTRLNSTNCDW